jgi:hypothetical protein
MQVHIAVLKRSFLNRILDGSKSIEYRGNKLGCAPHGRVSAGDPVFLKQSGGPVRGLAYVDWVEARIQPTREEVYELISRHARGLGFFALPRWPISHVSLVALKNVHSLDLPFRVKQSGRSAWLVLEEGKTWEDIGITVPSGQTLPPEFSARLRAGT